MALKGAEYLSKYSISSAKGRRVLCAKFRLSCGQNNLTEGDLPNSHPPLSSPPSYPSSNHKDEVYSVPAFPTLGPNERKNPKKKASISGVMFGAWRNEPGRQNGPDKSYSHSSSMPARTSEQEDEVKQSDSRLNGQQRPDVKGVTAGDEGQWVILDMYDDTGKSSLKVELLRYINRSPVLKLMHRCCAFFIVIPLAPFRLFCLRLLPSHQIRLLLMDHHNIPMCRSLLPSRVIPYPLLATLDLSLRRLYHIRNGG